MTQMQMTLPLAQRSVTELQEKAVELLAMAETARMAETRDALRRLADRFARLAESRRVEQTKQCANRVSWTMPRQSDSAVTTP